MPGIIGCLLYSGTKQELIKGRQYLNYSPTYKDDEIYSDEEIFCSRSHQNIIGEKSSPIQLQDSLCWVEGEIYNIPELKLIFGLQSNSEANLLLEAHQNKILESVLAKIDGFFFALIYLKKEKKLKFITDRYGLKPIYLWENGKDLIWSSELKGLLAFNKFPKEINIEGFECFYEVGHFLGTSTWFKNVDYQNASSVKTYCLTQRKIIVDKRYWTWASIKENRIPFQEASQELESMFKNAVQKRSNRPATEKYALALSGGLDSRAILAVLKKEKIKSFTFGKKDCAELKIAKSHSLKAQVPHRIFEISKENWFNHKCESVWNSDASISLLHFHNSQYYTDPYFKNTIAFNGFAGDLISGGSWLDEVGKRINLKSVSNRFSNYHRLDDFKDEFYNIEKQDPYYVNSRLRRFTSNGLHEIKLFENRIPFMDNDLIEFIYSISDNYRLKSKLYLDSLKNMSPLHFQKEYRNRNSTFYKKFNSTSFILKRIASKLGFENRLSFADYKKWYLNDTLSFNQVLDKRKCIYKNFLDVDPGKDHIKSLRLVTAEIWLQQIFNNKYKTTRDYISDFE